MYPWNRNFLRNHDNHVEQDGLKIGYILNPNVYIKHEVCDFLQEESEKRRYYVTQFNGQRTFGPPIDYSAGDNKEPLHEFVIKGIPWHVFEDVLLPPILEVGNLYSFRFMLDWNGNSRGFAFAKFFDNFSAVAAMNVIGKMKFGSKYLIPEKCENNNLIYIKNIPCDELDQNEVSSIINALNLDGLKGIRFSPLSPLGYYSAVIEYDEHYVAALAKNNLLSNRYEYFPNDVQIVWYKTHNEAMSL